MVKAQTRVGVLAVQGAVTEHAKRLETLGVQAVLVRRPDDLDGVDALVIPGGESTTIGRLIRQYNLFEPIRKRGEEGMPLFGTCAGMILLAKRIHGPEQAHLGLLDATVDRNSFGRQRDSFEAGISVEGLGEEPYAAVFIRAPHIVEAGDAVTVLARYEDKIVAARQGNVLVTSFHPELTDDPRMHRLFLNMIE